MKITNQLIAESKVTTEPDYLNLSGLNILQIENLDHCSNLRHLIVRNNDLDVLTGLDKSRQVWRLEASNNRIKNLDGFSKFMSIGTLNLHGNEFSWTELERIRHLHILDFISSNNLKFGKDPNYRKHMIDSLPNVWMLDGLLITSAERQEVASFFEESARSSRPTRHKLPKYQFVPSDQKKRDIYGDWSTKLMSKFAVNETKNIETDIRRLEFLAEWFEEIIRIDCFYVTKKYNIQLENCFLNKNCLRNLIEFRKSHTEMCNMVLVLLVASLQFRIPTEFLSETLNYTNLNKINNPVEETIKLFELPRISRIYISNLLLSAVKIDRDQKIETGFYDSLFVALRNILNEVFQQVNNKSNVFEDIIDEENDDYYYTTNQEYYDQSMKSQTLKDNKALLSTEIIQLFCIVPSFYDFLNNSEGLIEILNLSIGDSRMYLAVEALLIDAKQQNKTKIQICEELGSFITNLLKLNARQLINKKTKDKTAKPQKVLNQICKEADVNEPLDVHGTTAQIQNTIHIPRSSIRSASTIRSITSATRSARFLSPVNNANNTINEDFKKMPNLDDLVIIGRKRIGKIVRLEKDNIAEVKFDSSIILNELGEYLNPRENSLCIDLKQFDWDFTKNIWRPRESSGEINLIQLETDPRDLLIKNDYEPVTSRLGSSLNLNILSHLENHNFDPDLTNFKSTIIDSHRRILTVNLLDKNEQRADTASESSSNAGRSNKMVHFMLDFDNSSNGQLSAKTSKSLPQIQPSLNYSSSPLASKNFPGNKLTSIPLGRTLSTCRPSAATPKRSLSKTRLVRGSEFPEKWNDDEAYNFLSTERNENSTITPEAKQLDKESDDEQENKEMKVIIEPVAQENPLHNGSINSMELLSKLNHDHAHDGDDPYMSCDCNRNKHDSNIDINLEKTNLLSYQTSSRVASPNFLKGPTTSTITLVQPTVNNLSLESIPNKLHVNSYYNSAYQNYSNNQATRKKKIIKLQDCSNWLNVPQRAYSTLSPNLTKRSCSAYLTRNEYGDRSTQNCFPNANYARIQMLLSRKSNRVNTNPKMPVLTSPSSKDHSLYRGLRPDSSTKCFNLTSKKIQIIKC